MTPRTKLTPIRHKAIIEATLKGHFKETVAGLVGIDRTTMHDWETKGREDIKADPESTSIHAKFVRAVEAAEARCEAESIGRIRYAGREDWKADAWYLERRHQTRWGGKAAVEVNVRDTTVIVHASPEKPPELPD